MNETQRVLEIAGMPWHEFVGSSFVMFWVILGIVLAVAAVLMPLFVIAIYRRLGKMMKDVNRLAWYAQKEHERAQAEAERRARFGQ